jgi:RNA polymerase sigma-70 factor (family 1)
MHPIKPVSSAYEGESSDAPRDDAPDAVRARALLPLRAMTPRAPQRRAGASDPGSGPSDHELVARLRAGDERAFEAVFDAYVVPLCVFALSFVKSRELATEVVHDVFLQIWRRREQLVLRESLKAYLYRATHNRALNLAKRVAVEQRWLARAAQEQDAAPVGSVPPAQAMAEEYEFIVALEREVARFPERRRAVFLLRWRDGLSYEQIAELLGISTKTVENQITRALRALRARLASFRD